jgi:hypothetical protein
MTTSAKTDGFLATRPFDQGLGGKWHLAKRAIKKGPSAWQAQALMHSSQQP